MGNLSKDTMTLKNTKAIDVYNEVIGFMAVHGYYLDRSVEPVKIVGKKKLKSEGVAGSLKDFLFGGGDELHAGFWQRAKDLTVVIDFTEGVASDVDTIKGIIMHKFGHGEILGIEKKS